jgi:hypothetical protein
MKTLSQHPLVKMSPSRWAKLCDARRAYENRRAVRDLENSKPAPAPVLYPDAATDTPDAWRNEPQPEQPKAAPFCTCDEDAYCQDCYERMQVKSSYGQPAYEQNGKFETEKGEKQ